MKNQHPGYLALMAALAVVSLLASPPALAQVSQIDKEISPASGASDFGDAVAISDDWALVGDPEQSVGTGGAYVYRRSGGSWSLVATLNAPNGGKFGASVDLDTSSGSCRAVVGAPFDDNTMLFAGAVYVYDCSNWSSPTRLTPTDLQISDTFGRSVEIDGARIIAGSPGNNGGGVSNAGAAYLFEYDGSSWNQTQKLIASNPEGAASFGHAVAISGNRAAVGAPLFGPSAGAAYVFDYDGSSWQQQAFLEANDNDTLDRLGWSIAVSGSYVLTGAIGDDSGGSNSGAAYVFKNESSGWVQEQKLKSSDSQSGDGFGHSVDLHNYWAVVGASGEDEGGFSAGAAYLFKRDKVCSPLTETDKILANDASANQFFGRAVSLDLRSAGKSSTFVMTLVGAPGSSGAAYWFEKPIPSYIATCDIRTR